MLGAAILLAVVGAGASAGVAAAAPTAARACIKACKATRGTCLRIAKRRNAAVARTCSGHRHAHRACVTGVRRAFKAARTACRMLLADCRACCRAGGQGPRCPVGQPIDFTPPAPQDLTQLGLPTAESGRPIVIAIPGAQLEVDATRKDALTALGACARFITTCVVGAQALDDCARSAPPCGTEMPWEEPTACCAPSCFERYQEMRRAGTDAVASVDSVYYGTDSCMPGVKDLLRTGRQ
jgi:hypothetical protein